LTGVAAMKGHRAGKITLRSYEVEGTLKKKKTTYQLFDAAVYLDNDAVIAEYLSAAAKGPIPKYSSPRSAMWPKRAASRRLPKTQAPRELVQNSQCGRASTI
jgi:hypothetical protein